MEVYLDNSATTKVCDTSIEYANHALRECWYNPSSLYKVGMDAERLIAKTKVSVAKMLNCRDDEIFFTSCGTEANNTAIFGAVEHLKKRGNRIVTTSVEHPSVLVPMAELEKRGFEVVRLPVNKNGVVNICDLKSAITDKTILVSIMLVNNEIGSVMPLKFAAETIKLVGSPALLHCDAVQAFGKIPIDVKSLGVDLLSLSGHKIHAPKGVGALYKAKNLHIPPFILGGGQEGGFRSGTESVPAIYALCGAIKELENINERYSYITQLNNYAKQKLNELNGIKFNSPAEALPYIINLSVLGYRSETLLHFLEADRIYVSSGSACSKGKASHVLTQIGTSQDRVDSALRISLSRYNTYQDIDRLIEGIKKAQAKLRKR